MENVRNLIFHLPAPVVHFLSGLAARRNEKGSIFRAEPGISQLVL